MSYNFLDMIKNFSKISNRLQKTDWELIRNFKNRQRFFQKSSKKKIYYLNPFVFYSLIHRVFKKENIFISSKIHHFQDQTKLVEFLISQYVQLFQEDKELGIINMKNHSVVIFDFNNELFRHNIFKSQVNTIYFNSDMYQNLFVRPSKINPFIWYNSITQILKSIFKLTEIEAIEIETLLLNNDPFESFISGNKNINQLKHFGSKINDKFISILYQLLYHINFHMIMQDLNEINIESWTLDKIQEGIFLIKFPITLPIFLRKIISSIFIIKFILRKNIEKNFQNKLILILNNPNSNLSLDLLKYESFPPLNSLTQNGFEDLRFIFYNIEQDDNNMLKKIPYLWFQFIYHSICKFYYPFSLNLEEYKCNEFRYDNNLKKEIMSEVKIPKSPILLNL